MKLEKQLVEFDDGTIEESVAMHIAETLGLDDADAHGDFSPESQVDMCPAVETK